MQIRGGNKYHATFINDCMRYCCINLLRSTNKALEMFMCYKNKDENLFDMKIKVIKSDTSGEYKISFGEFFFQNGIIHKLLLIIHLHKMTLQNLRTKN